MGLENVPRCRHVKVNGIQCGSPALRQRQYCYFHDPLRDGKRPFATSGVLRPGLMFPMRRLEDANAVQGALIQVLAMLERGEMQPKIAGLMLYGLQTASGNLRNTNFEAAKPTAVIIDRDTLDQTCIQGPQCLARDFPDEAEADQEDHREV